MFAALIPIRKGSQRIKNKNIKTFIGKPLYEYIINTAFNSKYIKKIYINTDIDKIKNKYKSNKKVRIINRKKNLSGNCNMNLVIEDSLKSIKENLIIQLHVTSPFLKFKTIDKYLKQYSIDKKHDSYFSVLKFKKRLWDANSKPHNFNFNSEPTTQNLKYLYEENSGFYIFSKRTFNKQQNRIGKKPKMINLNKTESFDIDTIEDLNFIKKIMLLNELKK